MVDVHEAVPSISRRLPSGTLSGGTESVERLI